MANPVWGVLEKAQDDPQTILQAIAALIAAHEADEEAHLGAGESLQSHRASEIIDHLAASIVEDKVLNGELTAAKKSWNEFEFTTFFESFDAWLYSPTGVTLGLAGIYLATGSTINTTKFLSGEGLGDVAATDWDKKMMFQTAIKLTATTNQTIYFMIGSCELDGTDNSFGFKISDGTLYAIHIVGDGDTQVEYTTEISGITLTNFNIYRADFDPATATFSFWVNGILKTTQNTNIPTEDMPGLVAFNIKNTAAANKGMYIKYVMYSKAL